MDQNMTQNAKLNILVSIIMPVYNGEKYLKEAIDSILNQTYTNFEFIIIDDCSTDQSVKIISSYTDSRIHFHQNNENLNLIKTLNLGLHVAKGDYIARMDQDDISMFDRIEKQVLFLEANKHIGLVGSAFELLHSHDIVGDRFGSHKIIAYAQNDEKLRVQLIYNNIVSHPTAMFRKKLIDEHNLHYELAYTHAEDYRLWTQIAKFAKIANIDAVLLKYRVHAAQISEKFKDVQLDSKNRVAHSFFYENGFDFDLEEVLYLISIFDNNQKIEFSKTSVDKILILNRLLFLNSKNSFFSKALLQPIVHNEIKNQLINNPKMTIKYIVKSALCLKLFFDLTLKQKIAFLKNCVI